MNWTYMRHLKLKHVQFTSCVQGGAKSDRMTEVVIKKFLQGSIQNKVKFFEDIDNIFFSIKFSFRSEFLTFSFRFGTGLSFHYLLVVFQHFLNCIWLLATSDCFRVFVTCGSENYKDFSILWLWLYFHVLLFLISCEHLACFEIHLSVYLLNFKGLWELLLFWLHNRFSHM